MSNMLKMQEKFYYPALGPGLDVYEKSYNTNSDSAGSKQLR